MRERSASACPARGAIWTRRLGAPMLVLLGCALIVERDRLAVLPTETRLAALAAVFGGILFGSLLVPVPRDVARAPRALVLIAGLAGVGISALAAGTPIPLPIGPAAALVAVLAAIAEEALFRRLAYALLAPAGAAIAVGATALLFAMLHVPLYGVAAFPVDLGAGLLFGWQRWASGTWTVPAATHAAANLLAVIAR